MVKFTFRALSIRTRSLGWSALSPVCASLLLMLFVTEEIMKDQGKDRPIDSIHEGEHWRRWIGILLAQHPIEERPERPHQNKFDGR